MNDVSPVIDPEETGPAGDAFYTPPPSLPDGVPGDPVWVRPLDNPAAALEAGENWLVLYRSQDVRDTAVATSGIIVLPDRNEHPVPEGGYPLVSWAHGTVGIANHVAPSRDDGSTGASPMNASPHALLNAFLHRGWAVAMTDYEALGTGTKEHLHPYLLGASEANGVLDIVLAARRLFPGAIGKKFAVVGHSQGGQAALFAAHHAPGRLGSDSGLVGVAAIAPSNHPLGLVRLGAGDTKVGEGFAFTPLFLAGAMGGDPSITPEGVLSEKALELWPQALECSRAELSGALSWGGIKGKEQFKDTYPKGPNEQQRRFDEQLAAMNPNLEITVPVRISQAADDQRVQATLPLALKGTDDLRDELDATNEKHGIKVKYERYDRNVVQVPQSEPEKTLGVHFATIDHDAPALTKWLYDLFTRA